MLQIQSRRDPLGKKTPHPHCGPLALSPCLLNCGRVPRAPGGYRRSQSGAQCVRQTALRSPAERAGDPKPWPARGRQAGCSETPRLHVSTGFRAVSGSSLPVVPRSSPTPNHVLCASSPALASAVVFPVLFLYPRGVGPGVQGPSPSRGAPTTIIKALTGHFVIVR